MDKIKGAFEMYSSQNYELKNMLSSCSKTEEKMHVIELKIFASTSILSARKLLFNELEDLKNGSKFRR